MLSRVPGYSELKWLVGSITGFAARDEMRDESLEMGGDGLKSLDSWRILKVSYTFFQLLSILPICIHLFI